MTAATVDDAHDAWANPIAMWVGHLRAGGMSASAIELRRYQLGRVARAMVDRDPWTVTQDDITAWLASHNWKRESLRSYRSALRSFYAWAHEAGLIDSDPASRLRKVPPAQARPRPAPEPVIESALRTADERGRLAILLGAHAGMRRAEIAKVHTRDLVEDPDGWSLIVHGKGSKDRVVPLIDEAAETIRRAGGWVFPNGQGGHLTPAHLGKIVSRALGSGVTPHQLRHRFASIAYQQTHDIRAVQELLGHTSVATTQRYTAVADGALRSVVRAAGPGWSA